MKKRITIIILGVFCMLASASSLYAALQITEIMYDPQGTDTNREWIEIYNPDAQDVDLSQWSFWQGGTNHKIHTEDGSTSPIIPAGSYAILAHSSADFLAGWLESAAPIFDSSFSLKNTGELIELKNGDDIADQVNFDPTVGADGDGNSLQKNASGIFVAALPTPGAPFSGAQAQATSPSSDTTSSSSASTDPADTDVDTQTQAQQVQAVEDTSSTATVASSDPGQVDISTFPTTPQITCKINAPATWTVGVSAVANANALGLQGQPLQNAQYLWNFGDGTSAQDPKVAHTYRETGQYVISVAVGSGQYSVDDRVIVTVVAPEISISSIGENNNSVTLQNGSTFELDLSGFVITSHDGRFTFPQGSFIEPHQTLTLSSDTLGMSIFDDVAISYPNGVSLTSYTPTTSSTLTPDQPVENVKPVVAKTTKAKATRKVLSTKISTKVSTTSDFISDASDTDSSMGPIILSADEDGSLGDGDQIQKVLIFCAMGIAALSIVFVIMKKRKSA